MEGRQPFRIWFLQEVRPDRGFAVRYSVAGGVGAVQLRPSLVTSPTQPSGRVNNLSAKDLRSSFLLYRQDGQQQELHRDWSQFSLWDREAPAPETLPVGEWCEFIPRERRLLPVRPMVGWPNSNEPEPYEDGETKTERTEMNTGGRRALVRALKSRTRKRNRITQPKKPPAPAPVSEALTPQAHTPQAHTPEPLTP
ncbi:MAG: hypothetical protein AAFV53_24075, partial [Myxococcota bacterium]